MTVSSTTSSPIQATEFQMTMFLSRHAKAMLEKLKNRQGMSLLLRLLISDGQITSDEQEGVNKLCSECGISKSDLEKLASELKDYVGGWSAEVGEVESWINNMVFAKEDLSVEDKALLADVFRDEVVTADEVHALKAAGLLTEDTNPEAYGELIEFLDAEGGVPLSSLGLEATKQATETFGKFLSFGDLMLLMLLLMIEIHQKRANDLGDSISKAQINADSKQKAYTLHQGKRPVPPTNPDDKAGKSKYDADFAEWQKTNEFLKQDMEDSDKQVEEMLATMKRHMDKFGTQKKLFESIIDMIGRWENDAAKSIGSNK